MKKYLVIGNPISHSYSPLLHNFWLKKYNINGVYEKEKMETNELKNLILKIKKYELNGVNVTVPFKKEIIPYLDRLTFEAEKTQSVNTVYMNDNQVVGHNTDIEGFEAAMKNTIHDINGKTILILGAGGVVPSIIFTLNKMKASKITIMNRTRAKAEALKNLFDNLLVVDWGNPSNFDMVINATSLGLNNKDEINLDFSKHGKGKFFYDVIYNPNETNFLRKAKLMGNKIENGKKMFIYQAAAAFNIWHNIYPKVDNETEKLLEK